MYKSTRSNNYIVTPSQAIIKGIALDKGLYVPSSIPKFQYSPEVFSKLTYKELALKILRLFLTDFSTDELETCINKAYTNRFSDLNLTPLVKKEDTYFLELYHGPTLAFKDMALCLFPYLLKTAIKKNDIEEEVLILTATSGDTGKAALEGFYNIDGIKIVVFFPENGTSSIQKLQMVTQEGDNTFVVGINGNFDDAQNGVKKIFNDTEFNYKLNKNGYLLSSANSINIGRFLPQIVYHFHAYGQLLNNNEINLGEKINVVVPTGNFGNILSAYYAKEMGLPINKLICASNENNVLYDFLNTGIYDKRRELKITSSPSMDILISSNLERFLYHLSNGDCDLINNLMIQLNETGVYEVPSTIKDNLVSFHGGFATESDISNAIDEVYSKYNYVIDPHTAVGYHVYKNYKELTNDSTKTIVISTASPFKFPKNIAKTLNLSTVGTDFDIIDKLSIETNIPTPLNISNLKNKPILHKNTCSVDNMKSVIENFLKVGD